MDQPGAVMCAVSPAAGRQIRVGAGCEGEHRRDQRKAEEKKQDSAEKTPHNAIVAGFVSWFVREMFAVGNFLLVPAGIRPAPRRSGFILLLLVWRRSPGR